MLDNQNNVYIASCTQSNNFPLQAPIQPAYGGGVQDGCVFKMDSTLGNMIWSTYLGGTGDDAAYSVKLDPTGNAYVAGGTSSPNFTTTNGVVQPNLSGGIDGFITQINPAGNGIVASTFIGTTAYDQCYFLELDQFNNVYVVIVAYNGMIGASLHQYMMA